MGQPLGRRQVLDGVREAVHPAAAATRRQLLVSLPRLGEQHLRVAEGHDGVELGVVALDLREVRGHHLDAGHLAPVDQARELERRVPDQGGLPGRRLVDVDVAHGSQGRSGMRRLPMPSTTKPTTKATTVKPMTLRMLSLAIARTGSSQKGWIMLATASPLATDIEILPR